MSYLVHTLHYEKTQGSPTPTRELLARSSRLFEQFHCFPAEGVERRACARLIPEVLVRLGELRAVIYRSDRGQCGRPRTFVHFFDSPPVLASDPSGEQIYVVGGAYRITQRGLQG